MHQGTQEDIIIIGGFVLQKMPINSTYVALNAEKDNNLLHTQPSSVGMQWF